MSTPAASCPRCSKPGTPSPDQRTYDTNANLSPRLQLSPREIEVLLEVARGRTNIEAGAHLYIEEQTVKFHLTNIFRKLGVKTRGELVWRALELGLVRPPGGEPPPPSCPACGRPYS